MIAVRNHKGGNCNESITKSKQIFIRLHINCCNRYRSSYIFPSVNDGMGKFPLFVDPVSNKFTSQSIIIGIIMFSMGLTLTTEDFKILAQRPFDICIGAIAQYLIMPFLAFALTKY